MGCFVEQMIWSWCWLYLISGDFMCIYCDVIIIARLHEGQQKYSGHIDTLSIMCKFFRQGEGNGELHPLQHCSFPFSYDLRLEFLKIFFRDQKLQATALYIWCYSSWSDVSVKCTKEINSIMSLDTNWPVLTFRIFFRI